MPQTYDVITCTAGFTPAMEVNGSVRPTCANGSLSVQTITLNEVQEAGDVAAQLELIGVTAPNVTAAFVFGFGAYVAFWALGYLARMAVDAVKAA